MRFSFPIGCLLLLTAVLSGQQNPVAPLTAPQYKAYRPPVDISGTWVGELFQDAGGLADKFELSLQIRQIGPSIQGTSYVRLDGIWAEMEFSGYRQGNGSWKVKELRVVRAEKPEALSWCMKRYRLSLIYTRNGLQLSGPWWGDSEFGPCIPGSVRLEKKKKRV